MGEFLLPNATCVAACPFGFTPDGSSTINKCVACTDDCGSCSVGGSTQKSTGQMVRTWPENDWSSGVCTSIPQASCIAPGGTQITPSGTSSNTRAAGCYVHSGVEWRYNTRGDITCTECCKTGGACVCSTDQCNECHSAKYLSLDRQTCVNTCPAGTFGTGTSNVGRSCRVCLDKCVSCVDGAMCAVCGDKHYLSEDKKTCLPTCPSGFYGEGTADTGRVCRKCGPDCLACATGTSCTTCTNTKYLASSQTSCDDACETGFYGQGAGISGRACKPCFTGCATCTESATCQSCVQPGLFLTSDRRACVAKCPAGFYGASSGVCTPCSMADCAQCNTPTSCSVCGNSKSLAVDGKTCVSSCGTGFFTSGTGDTGRVCLAKATCGNKDGAASSAAQVAVANVDCGVGFLATGTAASGNTCAGSPCDPIDTPADKTACCVKLATCGDKDGAGSSADRVSDADCGEGYFYKPSSATETCKASSCDISPISWEVQDKNICCMKAGTCSEVTDNMCGAGHIYNTTSADQICIGGPCDPAGKSADKAVCCTQLATCGDKDGGGPFSTAVSNGDCGEGFVANATSADMQCKGAFCDTGGVTEDKIACCLAVTTCGNKDGTGNPVTDAECPTGYVYDPKQADAECSGSGVGGFGATTGTAANFGQLKCDLSGIIDRDQCCKPQASCAYKYGGNGGDICFPATASGASSNLCYARGTDKIDCLGSTACTFPNKASPPFSNEDCGPGLAYNASNSASKCESWICDVAGVASMRDRTACCSGVATCGSKVGGGGKNPVSDNDCGVGFAYDASQAESKCKGLVCDAKGVDQATCCSHSATCGDPDGAGKGSMPVSDADCGEGYAYDATKAGAACMGLTCNTARWQVGGVDRQTCCAPVTKLDECTEFATFSPTGVVPCAKCRDCAYGVQTNCSAVSNTVCLTPPSCTSNATFSSTGLGPCRPCTAQAACTHGVGRSCTPTADVTCKPPPAADMCKDGSEWSSTGRSPCTKCTDPSTSCSGKGLASPCTPYKDGTCAGCTGGGVDFSTTGFPPCRTCSLCAKGSTRVKVCTATTDTVCERMFLITDVHTIGSYTLATFTAKEELVYRRAVANLVGVSSELVAITAVHDGTTSAAAAGGGSGGSGGRRRDRRERRARALLASGGKGTRLANITDLDVHVFISVWIAKADRANRAHEILLATVPDTLPGTCDPTGDGYHKKMCEFLPVLRAAGLPVEPTFVVREGQPAPGMTEVDSVVAAEDAGAGDGDGDGDGGDDKAMCKDGSEWSPTGRSPCAKCTDPSEKCGGKRFTAPCTPYKDGTCKCVSIDPSECLPSAGPWWWYIPVLALLLLLVLMCCFLMYCCFMPAYREKKAKSTTTRTLQEDRDREKAAFPASFDSSIELNVYPGGKAKGKASKKPSVLKFNDNPLYGWQGKGGKGNWNAVPTPKAREEVARAGGSWIRVRDPESQKFYYFNELTQVSSWDIPKEIRYEEADPALSQAQAAEMSPRARGGEGGGGFGIGGGQIDRARNIKIVENEV